MFVLLGAVAAVSQASPQNDPPRGNEAAPRSEDQAVSPQSRRPGSGQGSRKQRSESRVSSEESSSRDTKIDLSPPPGDVKDHPESSIEPEGDVQEFHNYDPHRAEKNVEIGDYYFKLSNYAAAESRYREALEYKPNDAVATFRLATALEHEGKNSAARESYQKYLQVLPAGPYARESNAAVQRLASAGPDGGVEKRKAAKYSKSTSRLVKNFPSPR